MTGRKPLACLVILAALALVLAVGPASASASQICSTGVTNPCAAISVSKSGPYVVDSGTEAQFYFYVYNTGYEAVDNVSVSDDHCSPVSGPIDGSDQGDDGVLMPYGYPNYEQFVFTCTYTITGAPGSYVDNTATANAMVGGETPVAPATDSERTWISGIVVTKAVDLATADRYDDLHYTITVQNVGPDDGPAYTGSLQDQGCDQLTQVDPTSDSWLQTLYPGDSIQFTCVHNFNPGDDGKYTNSACFGSSGYDNRDEQVSFEGKGPQLESCADATTTLAQHVVTGAIFEDMNADGTRQSGEPAFPGIVVYADLNGNGARDAGEPSATSDASGNYSLNIDLGKTTIREDVPAGVTCSFPADCAYSVDLPINAPPQEQVLSRRVASRAADPTGKDFGDWRPASVNGTVVNDVNGNGLREVGDAGLAGLLVYADLNGNGTLDQGEPSATTAADGSYTIGGLKPGGYVIRHVVPEDGTSCTAPAGCNYDLTLVSNGAEANKDFLDSKPAQLVLPTRIIPGIARLTGKSGCIAGKGFYARIRGQKMTRIIFYIDGQAMKSVVLPKDNKMYRYRVDVSKVRVGHHTLAVKVTFHTNSHTRTKTLRLTFQRCAAQLRAPAFTG